MAYTPAWPSFVTSRAGFVRYVPSPTAAVPDGPPARACGRLPGPGRRCALLRGSPASSGPDPGPRLRHVRATYVSCLCQRLPITTGHRPERTARLPEPGRRYAPQRSGPRLVRSRPRPAPPPLGATCTGHRVGLGAGSARWASKVYSQRPAAARARSWHRRRRGFRGPAAWPSAMRHFG